MAILTGLTAAKIGQRPEFQLSEQQWYDRYTRPSVEQLKSDVVGQAGQGVRGLQKTQNQIVTAQLGGTDSSLGEAAAQGMAPTFRRAVQRALAAAEQQAGALTREGQMNRQRKRAKGQQELGTMSSVEAGLASLIPKAGPVIAGITQGTGALAQAALGETGRGTGRPLQTVGFDSMGGTGGDLSMSQGGGGLYDLYNLTYG